MATAKAATVPAKFSGFPKETLQFYKDVAKDNSREFFERNRSRYLSDVIAPAQAFVNEAGARLQKIRPGVTYSPDYSGKGSIKKIHTDTRFQKDRAPLKTYLDIMFWEGPIGQKKDNSVFFLRIQPSGVGLVTGVKSFQRPALLAYREALADKKLGKGLQGIVDKLRNAGYEIRGESLKQHPRGFDKTLPWAGLALYEAVYAVEDMGVPRELHKPEFVDFCVKRWKEMSPLHDWMVANVMSRL